MRVERFPLLRNYVSTSQLGGRRYDDPRLKYVGELTINSGQRRETPTAYDYERAPPLFPEL